VQIVRKPEAEVQSSASHPCVAALLAAHLRNIAANVGREVVWYRWHFVEQKVTLEVEAAQFGRETPYHLVDQSLLLRIDETVRHL
jgi:hypothetical protein